MEELGNGWSGGGGRAGFEDQLQHLQLDEAVSAPKRPAAAHQQPSHGGDPNQQPHLDQSNLLHLLSQAPQAYSKQPRPTGNRESYKPPLPTQPPSGFMQPPPGFYGAPRAGYAPLGQQPTRPPYMPSSLLQQPPSAASGQPATQPLNEQPGSAAHPGGLPFHALGSDVMGNSTLGAGQDGASFLKLLQHSSGAAEQQQASLQTSQHLSAQSLPPGFFYAPSGIQGSPHKQQGTVEHGYGADGPSDAGSPLLQNGVASLSGSKPLLPGFQRDNAAHDTSKDFYRQGTQSQPLPGFGSGLEPPAQGGVNYGLWSSGSGLWSTGPVTGTGGLWGMQPRPEASLYGESVSNDSSLAPGLGAQHHVGDLLGHSLGGILSVPQNSNPPGVHQQPPPGWSLPGNQPGPGIRLPYSQQPVGVSLGPSSSDASKTTDLLRLLQQGQGQGAGTAAFLHLAPTEPEEPRSGMPLQQQEEQQQQQKMYGAAPPPPPPPARAQSQHLAQMSVADRARLQQMQKRHTQKNLTRRQTRGGRGLKSNKDALAAELERLAEKLEPSREEVATQQRCFATVVETLKKEWPHCNVHLFGSCANGLSLCNNNDLDISIELPEIQADDKEMKVEAVDKMGEIMEAAGMKNVKTITHARVPIVKFENPDTGTKCDITINNELACINTKLLRDYASLDPRMRKLVFVVKHWAKRREVNEAYQGSLSSYAYVLMCIHLLQNREPPVLPCLQAIEPPTYVKTVGENCCNYYNNLLELKDFGKPNTESLADLIWAFFEFWAWRHDYNNTVISIRTGGFITKLDKGWTKRVGTERHLICIEDPFLVSHDLGRVVDRNTIGTLRREFERAARILQDNPNPLQEMMEAYQPPVKTPSK